MTGKIAKVNQVDIWYETFGDIKNPIILLMMGNSRRDMYVKKIRPSCLAKASLLRRTAYAVSFNILL